MKTWEELNNYLEIKLSSLNIINDQIIETKQFVQNPKNLPVYIYSDEHPPPHFHIKHNGKNASYKIGKSDELIFIKGEIDRDLEKKLIYCYKNLNFRNLLIQAWNNTRPSNCTVGKID